MAKWTVDPDHSVAAFAVRHMMIAHVRGQFSRISGTIYFDPAQRNGASVDVTIDVASITTGIRKRDEHLLSGDFFDARQYPVITFKSSAVEFGDANRVRVAGDLTVHGITHAIAFEGEYFGPVRSPEGDETSIGFSATVVLRREDYGITWNVPMEDGGVVVGSEVRISLDLEADLAE